MVQQLTANQPIGIFDSGIGGLTVARALVKLLPQESIIYFGDTAHLPYGEKSITAIQNYSLKIAQLLLHYKCKVILIACNSASAVAYEIVKEYVGDSALVIDVINPTIHLIAEQYANHRIGLIATKATIRSHIYEQKIAALNKHIELKVYAAPLLAQAIEEHCNNKKIMQSLIEEYLNQPCFNDIKALVLACTHYPVIKQDFDLFYGGKIPLIDNAAITAYAVQNQLSTYNLLNTSMQPTQHFYVSDYTDSFANHACLFFGKQIKLEYYSLWE